MPTSKHPVSSEYELTETTFLPRRVIRAADQAMLEVLEEDRLLRQHGIQPANGRSR